MSIIVSDTSTLSALFWLDRMDILPHLLRREFAEAMELLVMGLLGVLFEAKEAGRVKALKPILGAIKHIGFRIAPSFMEFVLKEAGESP